MLPAQLPLVGTFALADRACVPPLAFCRGECPELLPAPQPPSLSFLGQHSFPNGSLVVMLDTAGWLVESQMSVRVVVCGSNGTHCLDSLTLAAEASLQQQLCCSSTVVQGCGNIPVRLSPEGLRAVGSDQTLDGFCGNRTGRFNLSYTATERAAITTVLRDLGIASGSQAKVQFKLQAHSLYGTWVSGGLTEAVAINTGDEEESSKEGGLEDWDGTLGILGGFAGCFVLAAGYFLYQRRLQRLAAMAPISKEVFEEALAQMEASGLVTEKSVRDQRTAGRRVTKSANIPRELKRSDIRLLENDILGEGNFGVVQKAIFDQRGSDTPPYAVAVKTIKFTKAADEEEFIKEALASALFNHPNVIRLVGIVTSGAPHLMVLEFCGAGSLLDLLKKRANSAW